MNEKDNIQTIKYREKINMEIIFLLLTILFLYLIIKGAVHQGTLDALKEFEEYLDKKEKSKQNN
jgi:hypothetical protein